VDFRLLGPFAIRLGEAELRLPGAKERALLAILLLESNRLVPADRLCELLWGRDAPETAANALQVYISHIRRALEPGRQEGDAAELLTRPPGYELRVEPDEIDARRFEAGADAGRELLAREPERAAIVLRAALAEWRGPALAEFRSMPFAVAAARRLEERRVEALETRVEADLSLGRHATLVAELEALTSEHPLHEGLHAHLMLALYRSGRQAESLSTCDRLRRRLRDELGIDVSPSIRRLERDILVQSPALGWAGASGAGPGRSETVARVEILTGRGREVFIITTPRLTIGRDGENDVVLEGDVTVSRHHAEILRRENGWAVRDYGSSNGTFLGDERIEGEYPLRDGDELRVGGARLIIRIARRHGGGASSAAEVTQQLELGHPG
jgi:DNA-binding SARP family transcriptional activator